MEETIRAIQQTPVPTLLIVAGLVFILLGFTTRLGGMIEVSTEQKKLAIPLGLLILALGLVLHFNAPSALLSPSPSTPPAAADRPPFPSGEGEMSGEVRAVINDPDGYTNIRSGQSSSTTIVARVDDGEVFLTKPAPGKDWWPVRTADGQYGYIHRSRVRIEGASGQPR